MMISDQGLDLIKSFESLQLKAYPDPATMDDPWTIGYGSTRNVTRGMVITEDEAVQRLKEDVADSEWCVLSGLTRECDQGQFDAMVSLCFNIGCKAFKGSTLLKLFNAGDVMGAASQFARWNKAAGKEMAGLTRRRQAERALFLS